MAEGHSNGNSSNGNLIKVLIGVLTALAIGGIFGGINAWSDSRVLANELASHKNVEQQRLDELGRAVENMREEMKVELRELRQAIERKR